VAIFVAKLEIRASIFCSNSKTSVDADGRVGPAGEVQRNVIEDVKKKKRKSSTLRSDWKRWKMVKENWKLW
jgi:hypothetical protein